MATEVPQLANTVATLVVEAEVMATPEEGVGRDGDDHVPARLRAANKCVERCHVIFDVLQNVEGGDEVKPVVGERQAVRKCPILHGHPGMSIARDLDGRQMRLEGRHVAEALKVGQIATRSAACLEDSRGGGQSDAVKEPGDHSSSADEPPVTALVGRHERIGVGIHV